MADILWIKVLTGIRNNKKMKLIRAMPEVGDALFCIWIDFICMAGEVADAGYIYLTKGRPYSDEELAVELGRPIQIVRLAMDTYQRYRMITVDNNGILLNSFAEIQDMESLERIRELGKIRIQKFRQKRKQLTTSDVNLLSEKASNVTVTLRNANVTQERREEKNIREENDLLNNSFIVAIQKEVSGSNYRNYYGRLKIAGVEDDKVIIAAPNETVARHIEETGMALLNRVLFSINCDLKPEIVLLET